MEIVLSKSLKVIASIRFAKSISFSGDAALRHVIPALDYDSFYVAIQCISYRFYLNRIYIPVGILFRRCVEQFSDCLDSVFFRYLWLEVSGRTHYFCKREKVRTKSIPIAMTLYCCSCRLLLSTDIIKTSEPISYFASYNWSIAKCRLRTRRLGDQSFNPHLNLCSPPKDINLSSGHFQANSGFILSQSTINTSIKRQVIRRCFLYIWVISYSFCSSKNQYVSIHHHFCSSRSFVALSNRSKMLLYPLYYIFKA